MVRFFTLLSGSFFGLNSLSKAFAKEKSFTQPKIALIIDDIGFSRSRLRSFLELGTPLTFAVLPRLAQSGILSEEIHDHGHEIMLHQPMEPFDSSIDPGPGALYVGDKSDRIAKVIDENISEVPFALGINNHMGSKFTSCKNEMTEALKVIKTNELFFIDSLTTSHSTGYKTARKLNMTAARRNVFLDNDPEEPAILFQLHKLQTRALVSGSAIGIGHPYPQTAKAIAHFQTHLKESGVSLTHISNLMP